MKVERYYEFTDKERKSLYTDLENIVPEYEKVPVKGLFGKEFLSNNLVWHISGRTVILYRGKYQHRFEKVCKYHKVNELIIWCRE